MFPRQRGLNPARPVGQHDGDAQHSGKSRRDSLDHPVKEFYISRPNWLEPSRGGWLQDEVHRGLNQIVQPFKQQILITDANADPSMFGFDHMRGVSGAVKVSLERGGRGFAHPAGNISAGGCQRKGVGFISDLLSLIFVQ